MSDLPVPLTPPRREPIDKYAAAVTWIEREATELLPDDPDAMAPRQEIFL